MSKKIYNLGKQRKSNAKSIKKIAAKKNKNTSVFTVLLVLIVVGGAAFALFADWDEISSVLGLKEQPSSSGSGEPTEDVYVHFIDVGQGDCQLIVTPDYTVLIDSGEKKEAQKVISYLKSLKIERLDYIITTHPHSDHIGGMGNIIDEFNPSKLIMPKLKDELVPTTATFERMLDAIERNETDVEYAESGGVIDLGVCVLEIIAPLRDDYDNVNDYSVTIRLTHGNNSFLFTGDIEKDAENDILESGADIKADVLKVAHHGSKTSSKKKFLQAVDGAYAIIGVGAPNTYNHPNSDVVERLESLGYEIYRTDINGTIVFTSDGEGYAINYGKEAAA